MPAIALRLQEVIMFMCSRPTVTVLTAQLVHVACYEAPLQTGCCKSAMSRQPCLPVLQRWN